MWTHTWVCEVIQPHYITCWQLFGVMLSTLSDKLAINGSSIAHLSSFGSYFLLLLFWLHAVVIFHCLHSDMHKKELSCQYLSDMLHKLCSEIFGCS